MNRQEYIDRYGVAAYEKKLQQTREWRQKNNKYRKEEFIALFGREAWDKRQESHRRASKKWLSKPENTEKARTITKKWQDDNKERMKDIKKKFYTNHPLSEKQHHLRYKGTKSGKAVILLNSYRQADSKHNRGECTLTKSWILNNIIASSCIYCGDSDWRHLGADRLNNDLPHTPDNCVCACGICNIERQWKGMTVSEFVEYRKVHPRECDKVK